MDDWDSDMRVVLANVYRALKSGRWLSLCYHDTDPGTWTRLQNMLLDTGFEFHTVPVLDPRQKSSNPLTAEKVVKSDLVVNCRKPRPTDVHENGNGEARFVSQRVRDIVIEILSHAGGQTRDRLWDLALKRLLARSQMAEHRFDDILSEVAFRSESGRWFLKEEFEGLSNNDICNEEAAGDALIRFGRLRMAGVPAAFAAEIMLRAAHLAGGEIDEPQLEQYIRTALIKDKKDAAKFTLSGRLKGVEFYDCLFFYLTRIRQYMAFLNGEGDFPLERMPDARTLVAWLKHCATFGLAEEGVTLFEKSGLIAQLSHLSEDDRYDAEDYYTQCRRRAGKAVAVEDQETEAAEDETDE
jgi:hypothetical protein